MNPFFILSAIITLVFLVPGCGNGDSTIRHGGLSYNINEVFSNNSLTLSLAVAAAHGNKQEINRLVAEGAKIDDTGRHDITPLWWALWARNIEGFKALLDKGASPNAQRAEGFPIMCLAADIEDPRFLTAALEHGGDVNLRDRQSW